MAAKTTGNKTKITIEIGDTDFIFNVGVIDFNLFQNEMMPNNKVTPSENFLTATVQPDQAEKIIELCDKGYAVELSQLVAGEFKPTLDFKVKK